jgi:hypothetical protein
MGKSMNKLYDKEYDEAKREELFARVKEELKSYEGKSFLEQYGLYHWLQVKELTNSSRLV